MTVNRKFLITREEDTALRTKELMESFGYAAEIFPLCNIVSKKQNLANADKYDNIIISSKNAFLVEDDVFLQLLNDETEFLIVGKGLEANLGDRGVTNCRSFDNMANLAEYLLENSQKSYLYLRGDKVSYDLKSELNLNIEEVICYQASYPKIEKSKMVSFLKENDITDLMFFSHLNARHFMKIIDNEPLDDYRIYCLSERIAGAFSSSLQNVYFPKRGNLKELLDLI